MTDMFCEADTFTFLGLLNSSWPMTPARCGAQTRPLQTRLEVENCSARWASQQSAERSHVESVHSLHSPWSLGLLIIGGPLAVIFASWSCLRKLPGLARSMEIELPDGLQPLVPNSECLSLSTAQKGQYVRVTTADAALRASCEKAELPYLCRLKCK
eukprot:4179953-Amphidinium_carterae.1